MPDGCKLALADPFPLGDIPPSQGGGIDQVGGCIFVAVLTGSRGAPSSTPLARTFPRATRVDYSLAGKYVGIECACRKEVFGSMEVRPPAPLPLLRTQPYVWGSVAPPSGMPVRDVWVDCRQSTLAAAQPLQASRWHSDVAVEVSPEGVATGWQRGARTSKALLPLCRSAVPSMRKGEGRPRCRPPFPPGAHPNTSGGQGGKKQEDGNQVDLVVGSVCFQIRTFVNCVAPESMA